MSEFLIASKCITEFCMADDLHSAADADLCKLLKTEHS